MLRLLPLSEGRALSAGDEAPDVGCALPLRHATIQLAHGGGGRAMRELLERVFFPAFAPLERDLRHDSAVLRAPAGRMALTSDAYVIRPLFFPGGDIGKLAVTGTVNDLARAGAVPEYMTASFVLEEGFEIAALERIIGSMAAEARRAGVAVVTGDTKVVDRGHGDGVYIVTSGVGSVTAGVDVSPRRVVPGDAIVVSGDVGRHGIAVLSVREGLGFESALESDCQELASGVHAVLEAGVVAHCLRDLTRGGLAAVLCELALDTGLDFEVHEERVAVCDAVRAASELLGLDPWSVACEGRFVAFVPELDVPPTLRALRALGHDPACIGSVTARAEARPGRVEIRGRLGVSRLLELPYGEQLPRIC